MSTTSPETGGARLSATAPDYWINRKADDIPPGWIDYMIWRLFTEWSRQMTRFVKTGETDRKKALEANGANARPFTPERCERDARTLASLQRSLRELIKLETARQALRATKATDNDENPGEAFERRMARLLEASGAPEIPGEPVE